MKVSSKNKSVNQSVSLQILFSGTDVFSTDSEIWGYFFEVKIHILNGCRIKSNSIFINREKSYHMATVPEGDACDESV